MKPTALEKSQIRGSWLQKSQPGNPELNSPGDPAAGDEEHHRRELLVEPRHDAQAEAVRAAAGPGGRTSGHQPEYGMSWMGCDLS